MIKWLKSLSHKLLTKLIFGGTYKLKIYISERISVRKLIRASLDDKLATPTYITIDPGNICNLHCPFCPTGTGKMQYQKKIMSFAFFRKIIDAFPGLRSINLFNWGEPFLVPDIFKMIQYASRASIAVSIHSNFSLAKDDNFFKDITGSGLNTLLVSLDGASQSTYSRHRIGGDFDLVIGNLKKLVKYKKILNCRNPLIVWKFIVNKYNEHELETARKMAEDLGILFFPTEMGFGDELVDCDFIASLEENKKQWLPAGKKYILPSYKGVYPQPVHKVPCLQLFNTLVVNPDGMIFPCCITADKKNTFGDITCDSIEKIWNNDIYRYSRSLFSGKIYEGPDVYTICAACRNYKKFTPQKRSGTLTGRMPV